MTSGRTAAPLRLGLAGLNAHKRRFAGTFAAVFLGVAFLAGTMVMGDTLRASFGTLFASADSGTDTVVRGADEVKAAGPGAGTRRTVPVDLVAAIRQVPGVAAVAPDIEGAGQLVKADGTSLDTRGPTVAANWIGDARLNPYRLVEGRAPRAHGEIVVNRGAADRGGLEVGDRTLLRTPDPVRVTIVGLAAFGSQSGEGETTYAGMTYADAERYLMPRPGRATALRVRAAEGLSERQLTARVARVLPAHYEAITGTEASDEDEQNTAGAFLDVFTTLLTVFAGIALLVAAFSIHNTFAIVVAQRTRENALLRALGATRRQVLGSALAEAVAVAVPASAAGLLGGIGVAAGLQELFPAIGFPFPKGGLKVHAPALAVPLAVGLLVCVGSAVTPALRAGRTAPLAALRESAADTAGAARGRARLGLGAAAAGVGLTVGGAVAGPNLPLTALGAVLTLAAFVVLGPVASTVAVRVLGAPVSRLRGVTGALARRNALRSPRRTAATATALMIGVAVVSLFTVLGASMKATLHQTVDRSFAGDVAVGRQVYGPGGAGISPELAPAVAKLPEVADAVGLGVGLARVDGAGRELTVTDPAALAGLLDLGTVHGSLALGPHSLAVAADEADRRGLTTGSRVPLAFADGTRDTFTVAAVYDRAGLVGDYLVSRAAWEPHRTQDRDFLVAVGFRDGVSTAAGKAAVEKAVVPFGSPDVQTRSEYADSSAAGVDTFLTLVYALLALAVLIALLGIANTLTLAVHERTRELGLLRAVGQTRAQLRAMVRWESVVVAAFGTVGGIGLGGFLGWALVRAAVSDGTGAFALPPLPLAVVLLVGVAAGVLAGWRPARRAARLDILRAVAAD